MIRSAISVAILFAVPSIAVAEGGAHTIDDASVETPGICHLETWTSHHRPGSGLINVSPACTRKAWPRLEIGATVQHVREDVDDATIGPALKFNLRPIESGLGVGMLVNGNWSLKSGRLETAGIVFPVTFPVNDKLHFNVNGGWTFARTSQDRVAPFYGAQVMMQPTAKISLMAEVFRRDGGRTGSQFGLRWTPECGDFDVDLLVGQHVDGVSPRTLTFGLTVRR